MKASITGMNTGHCHDVVTPAAISIENAIDTLASVLHSLGKNWFLQCQHLWSGIVPRREFEEKEEVAIEDGGNEERRDKEKATGEQRSEMTLERVKGSSVK